MVDPTATDPRHGEKVELVKELIRRGAIGNLYLYAFECPEMEHAALQVARELEKTPATADDE